MTYPNFNFINCEQKLTEIKYFLEKENMTDQEKFRSIYNICKGRSQTNKVYNLKDIERFVCKFSGLTIDQINAKTRVKEIIQIRQLAHYLCHRYTTETLFSISNYFGSKHHSTVLWSIKAVKMDLKDNRYRDKYYDFICNPEEYLKDKNL